MTAGEAGPVYALGADAPERQRLRQQAKELKAHSEALLDRVGAAPGWRAIDLGCGPLEHRLANVEVMWRATPETQDYPNRLSTSCTRARC